MLDKKVIIGIVAGGGVGFLIGATAVAKYSVDNQNPGPNPIIQNTLAVIPTCVGAGVGAGVGYYLATTK